VVQQLVDNRLEGGKFSHEFGIHGVKLLLELGLEFCNAGIGRSNIRSHFLEGFISLSDGSLHILVASGGHLDMRGDCKGKWVGGTIEKEGLISDRYHDDHGEKRNIMGEVANRGTGKGVGSTEKKCLKMKGTTAIRARRGIQWDRSQIMVLMGPLYSFFFIPEELYSNLNNTTVAK
jgi:hypothetical protein